MARSSHHTTLRSAGIVTASLIALGCLAADKRIWAEDAPANAVAADFWNPRHEVRIALDVLAGKANQGNEWRQWWTAIGGDALRERLADIAAPLDAETLGPPREALESPAAQSVCELLDLRGALDDLAAELELPPRDQLPRMIRAAAADYRDAPQEELDALADAVRLAADGCRAAREAAVESAAGDRLAAVLKDVAAAAELEGDERTQAMKDHAVVLRHTEAEIGVQACIVVHRSLHRYAERAGHLREVERGRRGVEELEKLAAAVEKLNQSPDNETLMTAARLVDWLDDGGRASAVCYAVRRWHGGPNAHARLSLEMIREEVDREISERGEVHDVLLGATVSGEQTTTGAVTVELAPDDAYGAFDLVLTGECQVRSNATQGRVRVSGATNARFVARKRVLISSRGVMSLPCTVECEADNETHDVQVAVGPLLQGFAQRVAEREVARQQPQAKQIGEQRLRERIAEGFDREAGRTLAEIDAALRQRFLAPLVYGREVLDLVRFHTTDDAIWIDAVTSGGFCLGSPAPCATPQEACSLGLSIHESALNHAWDCAAGRLAPGPEFDRGLLAALLGQDPRGGEASQEADNIELDAAQPVRWALGDNLVRMTVRVHPDSPDGAAVDLTADYAMPAVGAALEMLRVPDDGADAANGADESGDSAASRDVAANVAAALLPAQLGLAQLSPALFATGDTRHGQLEIADRLTKNGWLTLRWRREPGAPSPLQRWRHSVRLRWSLVLC